jgi:hypothetical protein
MKKARNSPVTYRAIPSGSASKSSLTKETALAEREKSGLSQGTQLVQLPHSDEMTEQRHTRIAAYRRLYDHPIPPNLVDAAVEIRFDAAVSWVNKEGQPASAQDKRAAPEVAPRKLVVRKIIPDPPRQRFDAILTSPTPATVDEGLAMCLRERLNMLRRAKSAPVRVGKMLSRSDIATIAIDLLRACRIFHRPPGVHLQSLIGELLEADRPKATSSRQFHARYQATWVLAENPKLGLRVLARLVGVNPSTISMWRRDSEFQRAVDEIRQVLEFVKKNPSRPRRRR